MSVVILNMYRILHPAADCYGIQLPTFVTTCFLIQNSKFARKFRIKLSVLHLVLAALQLVPAVLNLVLSLSVDCSLMNTVRHENEFIRFYCKPSFVPYNMSSSA
jgi:hypothetical protein